MKINEGVRKENYERGLKYGMKIYCGQDFRNLIGTRVAAVYSDENDSNVTIWFEDDDKNVALYINDSCLDGEGMAMVNHNDDNESICLLRPVTEKDIQEIASMTKYYDIDVYEDNDEKNGINHIFCNDIALEGTERFKVKSLYVFYNGRIMTEKEL